MLQWVVFAIRSKFTEQVGTDPTGSNQRLSWTGQFRIEASTMPLSIHTA